MKRKIISSIMLLIGVSVIVFPSAREAYENYKQDKYISQWEETMANLDIPDDFLEEEEEVEEELLPEEVEADKAKEDKSDIEAMLLIDKIDLKLPIFKGASHENMKAGVGTIEPTGSLGKVGNLALSGHRNLTYGRNFNRLDELGVGDSIRIESSQGSYDYEIKEKLYVLPEDTWVLNPNGVDEEITLVTCHPTGVASHRLIIKGVRK